MTSRLVALLCVASLLLPAACSRKREALAPPAGGPAPAAGPPPPRARFPEAGPRVTARLPVLKAAGQELRTVGLSDIAERTVLGVVNVSTTRVVQARGGSSPFLEDPFFRFFRQPSERLARSLGSGVIVTTDGLVLTNNHVVARAEEIRVTLHDGRELKATSVGTDPKSDLAVLRIQSPPSDLHPLPFGSSRRLRLGEVVLAIGNPFGVGQTVTMGIVSAVGRANMGIVDYEDFIQTDAAINPGNSGGALVNLRGELVGINTAILSRSGGYQGIGFAIPSDMTRGILDSLLKHGRVIRGWLGIQIQNLTTEVAGALGAGATRGVLVADVQAKSPAEKAGLRRGDIITQLDGQRMDSPARLRSTVASAGSGARVKLTVVRKGKSQEITVVLGELPPDSVAKLEPGQGALGGLTVESLTDETRRRLGLPGEVNGVVVTEVQEDGPAQSAGVQKGDIILEINRQEITTARQFATVYQAASGKVLLLVYRDGTTLYLLLEK